MTMRNWSEDATEIFKGKTVARIRYTTDHEQKLFG